MAVSTVDLLVDAKYNPIFQESITSKTKLSPGISMAKFLGGDNDPVTLTHITDDDERVLLAKQYVLHAEAMRTINSQDATKEFKDFRLQVVEGLYRAEKGEDLDVSDGLNYLMSRGLAVVYELIGLNGKIAIEAIPSLPCCSSASLKYFNPLSSKFFVRLRGSK